MYFRDQFPNDNKHFNVIGHTWKESWHAIKSMPLKSKYISLKFEFIFKYIMCPLAIGMWLLSLKYLIQYFYPNFQGSANVKYLYFLSMADLLVNQFSYSLLEGKC